MVAQSANAKLLLYQPLLPRAPTADLFAQCFAHWEMSWTQMVAQFASAKLQLKLLLPAQHPARLEASVQTLLATSIVEMDLLQWTRMDVFLADATLAHLCFLKIQKRHPNQPQRSVDLFA